MTNPFPVRHIYTPITADLLPDYPMALVFGALTGIVGQLFEVRQELLMGVAILFTLNTVVSVVFSWIVDHNLNGELVRASMTRGLGYGATLGCIVIVSNMGTDLPALRVIAFQVAAGIEMVYVLAMMVRIVPRFRPFYTSILSRLDEWLPVDFNAAEVQDALKDDQDSSS